MKPEWSVTTPTEPWFVMFLSLSFLINFLYLFLLINRLVTWLLMTLFCCSTFLWYNSVWQQPFWKPKRVPLKLCLVQSESWSRRRGIKGLLLVEVVFVTKMTLRKIISVAAWTSCEIAKEWYLCFPSLKCCHRRKYVGTLVVVNWHERTIWCYK